jgi:hypothetical protein
MNKLHLETLREYKIAEITRFFDDVRKCTPDLLEIIEKVNVYCARYLTPGTAGC